MDWAWLLVGVVALMVWGVIAALLRFSAEEERRAAEAWLTAVQEPRRHRDREVWGEDNDDAA